MATQWKSHGDILVGDPDDRSAVARAKERAQKLADKRGRPVQIDFMNRYQHGGRAFRAPLTMVMPRTANPIPIGKWIKATIQRVRGGKFKVKIPGGLRSRSIRRRKR